MLDLLAKHALFDLHIKATGDRVVDDHHTVEDVGICLGQAVKDALGNKKGICRFAHASVPMQEALANIAVDVSGRSALVFHAEFPSEKIGNFDAELIEEFLEGIQRKRGRQPARKRALRLQRAPHSGGHFQGAGTRAGRRHPCKQTYWRRPVNQGDTLNRESYRIIGTRNIEC